MKAVRIAVRSFFDELNTLYPFLIPVFGVVFWVIALVMTGKMVQGDPRGSIVFLLIGLGAAFYLHIAHNKSRFCQVLFWSYVAMTGLYTLGMSWFWVASLI